MTAREAGRRRRVGWACLLALGCIAVVAIGACARGDGRDALSLEDATRVLGVGPGVLSQLADWRQIPARRVGREWRFDRAELLAWRESDGRAYGVLPAAPATAAPLDPPPARR